MFELSLKFKLSDYITRYFRTYTKSVNISKLDIGLWLYPFTYKLADFDYSTMKIMPDMNE